MSAKSGFEGAYRTVDRAKRQQEVLERAEAGASVKRIANDLGVAENAVEQIIERLRADGALPQRSTPSDSA